MVVIKTSFESSLHNVCAELVQEELNAFCKPSLVTLIRAPIFAVSTRVVATLAHSVWICKQVVNFLPRMVDITLSLAVTKKGGINPQFLGKAVKVYGLYFKTLGAQFAVGTMACIAPEISYAALNLQKPLFSLQLKAFIQTLSDLPHVQKTTRNRYVPMDSLVELYRRLGLSNDAWRRELTQKIQDTCQVNPQLTPEFLTTDSKMMNEAFIQTLVGLVADEINQRTKADEFHLSFVADLQHPAIWTRIKNFLSPVAQERLISLLDENRVTPRDENYYHYLYKIMVSENRTPDTMLACQILCDKMKLSRDEFIAHETFSAEDISCMYGASYNAIVMTGIMKFVDSSELTIGIPPGICFRTNQDKVLTFNGALEFFGSKEQLVAIKQALNVLSKQEKAVLIRLCTDEDIEQVDPAVKLCFQLLQTVRLDVIDKKISTESSIAWGSVFAV